MPKQINPLADEDESAKKDKKYPQIKDDFAKVRHLIKTFPAGFRQGVAREE